MHMSHVETTGQNGSYTKIIMKIPDSAVVSV
jgi:hypothetical protein